MRGKVNGYKAAAKKSRITPAYAGKSSPFTLRDVCVTRITPAYAGKS